MIQKYTLSSLLLILVFFGYVAVTSAIPYKVVAINSANQNDIDLASKSIKGAAGFTSDKSNIKNSHINEDPNAEKYLLVTPQPELTNLTLSNPPHNLVTDTSDATLNTNSDYDSVLSEIGETLLEENSEIPTSSENASTEHSKTDIVNDEPTVSSETTRKEIESSKSDIPIYSTESEESLQSTSYDSNLHSSTDDSTKIGSTATESQSSATKFDTTLESLSSSIEELEDAFNPDDSENGTSSIFSDELTTTLINSTFNDEEVTTSNYSFDALTTIGDLNGTTEPSSTLCSSNINRTDAYVDSIIDDVTRKLPPQVSLPDRQGRLQLYDGKLSGLQTIKRLEPSIFHCKSKTSYTVLVPLQMFNASANYKWQIELPMRTLYGDAILVIPELSANIFYFRKKTVAKVEDLKILSMEGIRVKFTGLGPFNTFASGFTRLMISLFESSFKRVFERTLIDAINVELNDVNKYQEFYE